MDTRMSEQPKKLEFFVYIVESPSAPDLYHGISEGARVADTLTLDRIPCVTRTAINLDAFTAALTVGLPEAMKQFPGRYPILHVSAHGSTDGVQLSSGDVLPWYQLRELLLPINQSFKGALLLCMSACDGHSACQMAMNDGDAPHPYFGMVGNFGRPTWSDTAVAYLAFYHLLAKGRAIYEAVEAMRAASGNDDWVAEKADDIKQGYLEFLKKSAAPDAVQRDLESVAQEQPLSPDVKALELLGALSA
jgi:hypothetical protein